MCVLLQPAFKQLQDELQARPGAVAGTCVRGGMDDTYIFCRPEDMAWAYGRLEELLAARGLKVQMAKSLCYAPVAIRHRLAPELVQGAMCRMGAPVGGALEIIVAGGVDGPVPR